MVVHAKTRWHATVAFAILGALALVHNRFDAVGVVLATLALVPIAVAQRMCLRADNDGVTVINLLLPQRVPWADISDFQIGRVALSTCLDVYRRDGTRIHAWVVTTTGNAALPSSEVGGILRDLRQRLLDATGEHPEDLRGRAIENALAAADKGRYEQSRGLVAEGLVDAEDMARRLIESRHGTVPQTRQR